MDPGHILEAKQTRFADGLDMEVGEREESRATPKFLAWGN